jgi:hypothetical protein
MEGKIINYSSAAATMKERLAGYSHLIIPLHIQIWPERFASSRARERNIARNNEGQTKKTEALTLNL